MVVQLLVMMLCQAYRRVLFWGPLCSCFSINGLEEIPLSAGTKVILYADDILVYKPISSLDDHHPFQGDLNAITSWLAQNSMAPNSAKCKNGPASLPACPHSLLAQPLPLLRGSFVGLSDSAF